MSEYERRDKSISLRVTPEEMSEIQRLAEACGCGSVSEYIRLAHSSFLKIRNSDENEPADFGEAEKFFDTKLGGIYHGNSLQVLHKILKPKSVDLIVTSPPFGLIRKKSYGNEAAEKYCKWFRPFAEGMKRVLKPNGSLVIDIGGSWEKGKPTRSLYHFELLLMLCKEFGFHLCQEHYYWSPSRLPTPAEWVNIRRVRVKDAVNCIWWLSKTPYPKADNRRVLAPYSKHMERLLKTGYQPNLRPSGHNISSKFKKNNGGAIPPNILAMPNTESNSSYMSYCEKMGLKPHPARFPSTLPEYFVRFLTNHGDLVLDPFAGSCVTGQVCEELSRRWVCVEESEEYLQGALGRFQKLPNKNKIRARQAYSIWEPCSLKADDSKPISREGGRKRPVTIGSK